MKSIVLIVAYFGAFPNYFTAWLKTCRNNPTINWLVITDNTIECGIPENVKFINIAFEELRKKIQKKYPFYISLNSPYKLCDFKPAYGEIFQDEIKGYDFWGHCDMDLLWGDLRCFITDEVLSSYDRLFLHGHLVIYRNSPEINGWYRTLKPIDPNHTYEKIFSINDNYAFDESGGGSNWGGMNLMVAHAKKRQYSERFFDDIFYEYNNFVCIRNSEYFRNIPISKAKYIPVCYQIRRGKLYRCFEIENNYMEEEIMYVHFQKRPITISTTDDEFTLVPNQIISNLDTQNLIKSGICRHRTIYGFYLKKRIENAVKRIRKCLKHE